jgi:Phycobilisome protein
MSTPDTVVKAKLRDDARIRALFQAAESRHLTAEEYAKYLSYVPQGGERSAAAREIMDAELAVASKTIKQVFSLYPYPKYHELPLEKCVRDVSYVSVYATHSMLLDDPDWFQDKLLIWLKTILQSFTYPAREEPDAAVAANRKPLPNPEITEHADTLNPKGRRSIYETYTRLIVNYEEVLTAKTFRMIRPHLQLAADILSSD